MITIYDGKVLNNQAILENVIFEKDNIYAFLKYTKGTEDSITLTYSLKPDSEFSSNSDLYNFLDSSFNQIQTQLTESKSFFYSLSVPKIACDFYIDVNFVNSQKTDSKSLNGDGSTKQFSTTLLSHPVFNKTTVTYVIGGTTYHVTDVNGNISDANLTGTVDNVNDTISLTFNTAPDNSTNIVISYTYENKGNLNLAFNNYIKHV